MEPTNAYFKATLNKTKELGSAQINALQDYYSSQELADAFFSLMPATGITGSKIVYVPSNGTDAENGQALIDAYTEAAALTNTANNRATVLVTPGRFELSSTLVLNQDFVNVVSLTPTILGSVLITNRGIDVTADDSSFVGISCGTNRFKVNTSCVRVNFSYCEGGNYSFGATSGAEARGISNGVYKNCKSSTYSFGYDQAFDAGEYYNCAGGLFCFGSASNAAGIYQDCTASSGSFGGFDGSTAGQASGRFVRCFAANDSFGGGTGSTASGSFYYCEAANDSFGKDANSLTGSAYYCKGSIGGFQASVGGVTLYCISNNAAL